VPKCFLQLRVDKKSKSINVLDNAFEDGCFTILFLIRGYIPVFYCSKIWSHLVGLIRLVLYGLVLMDFSSVCSLFFSFSLSLFKLYIINHDVTYWRCLFYNVNFNICINNVFFC